MADVGVDSSAIVTSVLGAVGLTIGGFVTIAVNLQAIFFKPLLEIIREYLKQAAEREKNIASEIKSLREHIEAIPVCNHSDNKEE